jgi:hypothetical protein
MKEEDEIDIGTEVVGGKIDVEVMVSKEEVEEDFDTDKEEVNPLGVELIIEEEIVGVETEVEDIWDEVRVDALVGE